MCVRVCAAHTHRCCCRYVEINDLKRPSAAQRLKPLATPTFLDKGEDGHSPKRSAPSSPFHNPTCFQVVQVLPVLCEGACPTTKSVEHSVHPGVHRGHPLCCPGRQLGVQPEGQLGDSQVMGQGDSQVMSQVPVRPVNQPSPC